MSPLVDISQYDKRCYENTGNSTIGVVILQEFDGKPHGIPLGHGERVWLNEIEERLTRNAPKSAEDNPFANGDLALIDTTADVEAPTPVEVSPEEPTPEPEAPPQDLAPHPDLPPSALPPGQGAPQTVREPPQEGSLEDAALEAASAAQESGAAPTTDASAPETVVEQIEGDGDVSHTEETAAAVEDHTAEVGVAVKPQGDQPEGAFKAGEEVATPDAPGKAKDEETGAKPKASRSRSRSKK